MTKKRKIEVLKEIKKNVTEHLWTGLCAESCRLRNNSTITQSEYEWLKKLIEKKRPQGKGIGTYYWNVGVKAPRIKWINQRIKELQ